MAEPSDKNSMPAYKPVDDKPPRYEITEKDKRELANMLVAGLRFGKYYTDEIG